MEEIKIPEVEKVETKEPSKEIKVNEEVKVDLSEIWNMTYDKEDVKLNKFLDVLIVIAIIIILVLVSILVYGISEFFK